MLFATARAPQPGNEKGYPARRPSSIFSSNNPSNSAAVLRLQCLERAGSELFGPYPDWQAAIAKAYAVNRDDYGGDGDVAVCDAALADRTGVATRAPLDREDF